MARPRSTLLALLTVALVAAGAAAWAGWSRALRHAREQERLEAQVRELQARQQADEPVLRRLKAAEEEVERLRKLTEEIHRLRGQYQEGQRQQAENERLRAENAQLRASQQQLSQAAAAAAASTLPAAWIGISMRTDAPPGSVVVESIIPGGPAANSGLAPGDVITAVDGRPVAGPQQLREIVGTRQAGQVVTLDVRRGAAAFRSAITTGAFPR